MPPLEFNIIYCHHAHEEEEPCNDDCVHSPKCKNPSHDIGNWGESDIPEGTFVEGGS